MENQQKDQQESNNATPLHDAKATDQQQKKVEENEYTPQEKEFADGEGTKLDEAFDDEEDE